MEKKSYSEEQILQMLETTNDMLELIQDRIKARRKAGDPEFADCPDLDEDDGRILLDEDYITISWKERTYDGDTDYFSAQFATSELWDPPDYEQMGAEIQQKRKDERARREAAQRRKQEQAQRLQEMHEKSELKRLQQKYGAV